MKKELEMQEIEASGLTPEEYEAAKKRAEERLAKKTDIDIQRAEIALKKALIRINVKGIRLCICAQDLPLSCGSGRKVTDYRSYEAECGATKKRHRRW